MSEGPVYTELPPGLADAVARAQPVRDTADSDINPYKFRVSPLGEHAHLRRTVGAHHEALQVHQTALQAHATAIGRFNAELERHEELLKLQANAREELRRLMVRMLDDARTRAVRDADDRARDMTEPLRRGFLGRLRFLFFGS